MAMIRTLASCTMLTLTILLHSDRLHSASLGPHSAFKANAYAYPDPNMIKALEFIENLKQNNEDETLPDYDARGTFRPFQEPPFTQQLDNPRESSDEGRNEWTKLLLQALMQAESENRANAKPYRSRARYQEEGATEVGDEQQDYDGGELSASDKKGKGSAKHHIAFPEYGYGVSPYKRTNEIIEEQYTPQSLATLESAFRELGKYTVPRTGHGRLEEEHVRKDEEDDISRASDFAYEDVADGEDWDSVEIKNRHQKEVQVQDEETGADSEPAGAVYNIKKALAGLDEADLDLLDSREEATREEDAAGAAMDSMLQYYKRLQDRMGEGQLARGAENAGEDRRVGSRKVSRGAEDGMELLDQLVELSSRLQIPPDDILEMLKDVEQKKPAPGPFPAENDSDLLQENSDMEMRESKRFRDGYNRGLLVPSNADEDLTIEGILNILGRSDRTHEKPGVFRKPDQLKPRQFAPSIPFQDVRGHQETDNRAISTDDEELTRYLERVLAKNPDLLNAGASPRARIPSSAEEHASYQEAESSQDPVTDLLRDLSPREAAELMSIMNSLSSFRGNGYHAPRRQQKGDDFARMILKLKEALNQRDGSVDELNRERLVTEQYE
ncbi:secretogranin-2-like [Narcine bancroftii]|uniref:secretogranin-2-like n=1 Tax=Narcine bancroftii TaxID=1343680 RepID=UPI003831B713